MTLIKKRSRGMTLVTVGMSLMSIFAIAALAVDIGKLYVVRTQLQNAADAGALAGAYVLTQPWWGAGMSSAAQNAAVVVANSNKTLAGQVAITTSNVTVNLVNRTVQVQALVPGGSLALTFAKVVGINGLAVKATGMAHASTSAAGGGVRCLRPFYIPNSAIAPAGTTGPQACAAGQTIVNPLNAGTNAGKLSSYAQSYFSNPNPTSQTFKYSNPSSGQVAASQFGLLGLCGNGASAVNTAITTCIGTNAACGGTGLYKCGDNLPLDTGNKKNQVQNGIDNLIGSPNQDIYVAPGRYQSASTGQISDTSNSLVTVAVYDDCTQTICSGSGASQSCANPQAVAFAQMFITGVNNQGNFTGYIMSPSACTDGSGSGFGTGWGTGTGTTGPGGIPIQLVQ